MQRPGHGATHSASHDAWGGQGGKVGLVHWGGQGGKAGLVHGPCVRAVLKKLMRGGGGAHREDVAVGMRPAR